MVHKSALILDRDQHSVMPPPRPVEAPRRRRRWLVALAVVALLAAMAYAMITTAVEQTPTFDEPVYVGTAVVYRQQHSLRYNPEHPPLGKLVIGVGTAFAEPRLDPAYSGNQAQVGRQLLYGSGNDPGRLMLFARLPIIVLTLLFGLVVFAFARDMTGAAAGPAAGAVGGLLALALYAFSPDVIAHGSLATLDVPAAGFLLTSAWLLWRARRRPWLYAPLAGLALGAALATKSSALAAVPVLLPLVVLSVWHARRSRAPGGPSGSARALALGVAAAAGVGVLAVAVVWASYLAVDPRLYWVTPDVVPAYDGMRGRLIGLLPFPQPYRDGVNIQFLYEDKAYPGFLLGRSYRGSLWYYLPVALLIKTPLGALVLWLAGTIAMLARRRLWPAVPYVLLPAGVLLAAVLYESRNFGVRYAIAVPMFLAVAAAGVVVLRSPWPRVTVAARVATAALVLFVAASSARAFPYYLPYSNEAFGGPASTHLHLHDSNVDWGQDLGRLAEHLRRRYPGEKVWLVYYGSGVPTHYGIGAANPFTVPPDQVRGLLVVSDTRIAKADGRLLALLDGAEPVDAVGHSITIFRRR